MRIALFAKLDALAPAYLLRRRSGDLIALASAGCRDDRVFLRPYRGAGPGRGAGAGDGAAGAGRRRLADRAGVAALCAVRGAGAGGAAGHAIDRLGAEARDALGLLGAYVTETIQGLNDLVAFQAVGRPAPEFHGIGPRLSADPARIAGRSVGADGAARNRDRARRARGRDGRRAARRRARACPDHAAAADPAVLVIVSADFRDRPGQPAARRHDRLDPPVLRGAARRARRRRRAAPPARTRRRLGDLLRGRRLYLSRRAPPGLERHPPRSPSRGDVGIGRAVRRRQDHDRQFVAALLGPAAPGGS